MTARLHRVSGLARSGLRVPLAALLVALAVCIPPVARSAASPAVSQPVPAPVPQAGVPLPARDGPEALAATRRLLGAGLPALALMRIERAQVPGPRWAEWEALRLSVLGELGLWRQVVARAEALPVSSPLPGPFLRMAWLAGADAALRMPGGAGDVTSGAASTAARSPATPAPAVARALAARVVWSPSPTPDEVRRAQLIVIESLFAGGDAPAGYRSILRFRQDSPMPGAAASARFVALVAAHGTMADAVPLLPWLPETHLVRIAVQAQLGLVPPSAAAAQARAAMRAGAAGDSLAGRTPAGTADGDPMRDLEALRAAARSIGETLLVVEASERLLDADPSADGAVATARALWRDYLAAAPAVANREQLLGGDAFGWSDAAARLAARDPAAARTLFAFLAVNAPDAMRATARLQFASLLREAGLGRAAVRLFLDGEAVAPSSLAPDLRRLLGETAAARRMWVQAADFQRALAPRPGEDAAAWRMASAELQARAGRFDDAVDRILAAAPLRPDLAARAHALADVMADAGEAAAAARVREAAGPAPAQARRP